MKRIATFVIVSLLLASTPKADSIDEDDIHEAVGSPQ